MTTYSHLIYNAITISLYIVYIVYISDGISDLILLFISYYFRLFIWLFITYLYFIGYFRFYLFYFILFYCILCESLLYLISISFIFIACFHFYFARSIWNEKNFPPGINKVFWIWIWIWILRKYNIITRENPMKIGIVSLP